MFLTTDKKIMDILLKDYKENPDSLLRSFNIGYPSREVASESNNIFVAVVSSENELTGYDFDSFRDLVEILIVTKQENYTDAVFVIKTVSRYICNLLRINENEFDNKPVIRNVNPEFNTDYVLNRGHILVEVKTKPESYNVESEDYRVCKVLLNNDIVVD